MVTRDGGRVPRRAIADVPCGENPPVPKQTPQMRGGYGIRPYNRGVARGNAAAIQRGTPWAASPTKNALRARFARFRRRLPDNLYAPEKTLNPTPEFTEKVYDRRNPEFAGVELKAGEVKQMEISIRRDDRPEGPENPRIITIDSRICVAAVVAAALLIVRCVSKTCKSKKA
jgi:hypothetical protein